MATDKLELNVAGMTCVNCSNAIEKVTAKMDGVEEAKVSFASSKAEFIIVFLQWLRLVQSLYFILYFFLCRRED